MWVWQALGLAGCVAATLSVWQILKGNYTAQLSTLMLELSQERETRARAELLRQEERKGRVNAEKELRALVLAGAVSAEPETQMRVTMQPIGFLQSCFRTRNGTPRQSLLVSQGRAVLRLDSSLSLNAQDAFDGLEGFSHVWLIFLFHDNTNTQRHLRSEHSIKAKVTPPRLGRRIGLFATRTPHRPNAIGLSVAKLERIENGVLHLSGIDLIDGTPILDVKGYLPRYEAIATADIPSWIDDATGVDFDEVSFSTSTETAIDCAIENGELQFFTHNESAAFKQLVQQVLRYDIRSRHRKEISSADHCVHLDNLILTYTIHHRQVVVVSIANAAV